MTMAGLRALNSVLQQEGKPHALPWLVGDTQSLQDQDGWHLVCPQCKHTGSQSTELRAVLIEARDHVCP